MKIKFLYFFFSLLLPTMTCAQGINFQLSKMKSSSFKCQVFFEVTNNSGLNITFGNADLTLKEKDGSIIDKDTLLFNRVKKGETVVADALVGEGNCSIIRSIEVQLRAVSVDGDMNYKMQNTWLPVVNSGKKSSLISNVVVK